tara:strand:- start:80 stop:235 length:156 start_codon:yes stop_codon:yes gene_type:complete
MNDYRENYKTITIPITEEDVRIFKGLVEGQDSFTWTFDEVNVKFIKQTEEE